MNKLERDILKSLAESNNTGKRISVILPDLPKVKPLAKDPNLAWKEDWDKWNRELRVRKVAALLALAEARDIDPAELVKVADLVIEVVPPEMRGRKRVDRFRVFMLVAVEMRKGKSQKLACELAGVSDKTFRNLRKEDPVGWLMIRKSSVGLPESVIRELAEVPQEKK